MQQYFDFFGLPTNASIDQIKTAYRRRALKLHPDVNNAPNAEEQFTKLNEVYNILIAYRENGTQPYEKTFRPPPPTREELYREEALRKRKIKEEYVIRKMARSKLYIFLAENGFKIYGTALAYLLITTLIHLTRTSLLGQPGSTIFKILWIYIPIAVIVFLVYIPDYSVNKEMHKKILAYRQKHFSKN